MGISQSALNLFRDCPYAYKLKYLDRVEGIYFSNDAMDTGGYVHDAIDMYYRNHFLQEGTSDDILYHTYTNLKNIWDTTLSINDFKKAYTCLQHHSEWEYSNINKGIRTQPLTEVEIEACNLYGFIDYVDLEKQQVIDWKTNSYATLSYTYRVQASIYKILFEAKFNMKLKYFHFFFLYPNTWRIVKYGDAKQERVDTEVNALLEQLNLSLENREFEKNPRTNSWCKSCPYKLYCKVMKY